MIETLIPYGGVIYWLLLFFGISLVTVSAIQQEDPFRPTFWALVTAVFAFGFTSYQPSLIEVFMALVVHLIAGVCYAGYRWGKLVYEIKALTKNLGAEPSVVPSAFFLPNNAADELSVPPDPVQFRTRILKWILFWPCFTIFCSIEKMHKIISRTIWKLFDRMAKAIYDS